MLPSRCCAGRFAGFEATKGAAGLLVGVIAVLVVYGMNGVWFWVNSP